MGDGRSVGENKRETMNQRQKEIQKMEISELCDYCFDIINAPLLKEYPYLKDTQS